MPNSPKLPFVNLPAPRPSGQSTATPPALVEEPESAAVSKDESSECVTWGPPGHWRHVQHGW